LLVKGRCAHNNRIWLRYAKSEDMILPTCLLAPVALGMAMAT
jgi:hypothetical protein